MANIKPRVVVTRKLPEPIETRMAELFDVRLNESDSPFSEAQLAAAVQSAEALVPTVTDNINAEILSQAGSDLRLLANFGAGVNHIDLKAAADKGLTVTNTPDVLTEDTADLAMALILAAPRRIAEGERILRSGAWAGWAPTGLLGRRVTGKKLGIIGMGRIGAAVARRARGFDMAIHYHNRNRADAGITGELGATYWPDLDAMLAAMDVVSVNCPLTPATHHLLSMERLRRMRPHAFLVNTSRGEVIDEAALAQALQEGRISGAGLDVFEDEPVVNAKLLAMENVVLLPHMGSSTEEARNGMGEKVIANIQSFLDGGRPPDLVVAEA